VCIASETVQSSYHQSCTVDATGGNRFPEFRSVILLATFDLDELSDHLPSVTVKEVHD
jgi:hypothetical protein